MRTLILLIGLAAALCCTAAEKPAEKFLRILPEVITRQMIAKKEVSGLNTFKYNGREFLVVQVNLGDGVPYTQIGIYAPKDNNKFQLSLFAESWAAGSIKGFLNDKAGILELRETANSELKGELVLSCNLKTIGTQSSVSAK